MPLPYRRPDEIKFRSQSLSIVSAARELVNIDCTLARLSERIKVLLR